MGIRRKILFLFVVLSLFSCVREHNCVCTVTVNGQLVSSESETITGRRQQAKKECNSSDIEIEAYGVLVKKEYELE